LSPSIAFKEPKPKESLRFSSPTQKVVSETKPIFKSTVKNPTPKVFDRSKYMKPDLVWYAAYDEDINEIKFIEKLQTIDQRIEPLLPE
jgi:hypothetical protein